MKTLRTLCILLLMLLAVAVRAQSAVVEARVDTAAILIGQQIRLTVTATAAEGTRVKMPVFKPRHELARGLEVVSMQQKPEESADDGRTVFTAEYRITSFDEGIYRIPAMKVRVGGKDIPTKPISIRVNTVDVDIEHPEKFFPMKDVVRPEVETTEVLPTILWLVLALMCTAMAVYLFIRLRRDAPIVKRRRREKVVPAHQKALEEIEAIKNEHLGRTEPKELYTLITDVVRRYITARFGFNAMEMTSAEIIDGINSSKDSAAIGDLCALLRTSDLVKFARYVPDESESEESLLRASSFVGATRTEEVEHEEVVQPVITEADRAGRRRRIVVRLLIVLMIVAVLVSLVFMAFNIYKLT